MARISFQVPVALCLASMAFAFDEPPDLREHFMERIKAQLSRLPDYVCHQAIERFARAGPDLPLERQDTLNLEVAMVGNQELYSLPGASRFENKPLAQIVGKGSITTGHLGLFATHVFLAPDAQFTYKGETEQDGRRAHEYAFDVPAAKSGYRLRSGPAESVVAFQGSFWIDVNTLDLIRLEVQAYDIPDNLGLSEVNSSLLYSPAKIDGTELLLPIAATLSAIGFSGEENLNRTTISACRHYRSDSTVRFAVDSDPVDPNHVTPTQAKSKSEAMDLPKDTVLDLALDSALDLGATNVGDRVRAMIARPVTTGEGVSVPQGAKVWGHIVRIEKMNMPFPIYDIGLQFDALEVAGRTLPFTATMIDAGPAAGLLRQQKHLDPKFSLRRTNHIDVLVREVQHGQGILGWDARQGSIPKGLRMKWRVGTTVR